MVVTPTMTSGQFLCLDAPRAGYIADREEANIRIAEQHSDFFVKNLVAIRCEERLTLVIEKSSAIIYGGLNYAG